VIQTLLVLLVVSVSPAFAEDKDRSESEASRDARIFEVRFTTGGITVSSNEEAVELAEYWIERMLQVRTDTGRLVKARQAIEWGGFEATEGQWDFYVSHIAYIPNLDCRHLGAALRLLQTGIGLPLEQGGLQPYEGTTWDRLPPQRTLDQIGTRFYAAGYDVALVGVRDEGPVNARTHRIVVHYAPDPYEFPARCR